MSSTHDISDFMSDFLSSFTSLFGDMFDILDSVTFFGISILRFLLAILVAFAVYKLLITSGGAGGSHEKGSSKSSGSSDSDKSSNS